MPRSLYSVLSARNLPFSSALALRVPAPLYAAPDRFPRRAENDRRSPPQGEKLRQPHAILRVGATLNRLATTHDPLLCTRILLVEDDDCLYQALRDSLQDAGCEVFGSCERVCFPIDTVPASRLDAALLDMDPHGSPRASALAQQLGARNVPIVWITSARSEGNVPPALQTDQWLRKPFSERELLDSIACALGRKLANGLH